MNDLVARLRDTIQILATTQMNLSMEDWDKVSNAVLDAAGTIKRLRDDNSELMRREIEAAARIEQLEAALREISGCKTFTDRQYMINIARAALEERT